MLKAIKQFFENNIGQIEEHNQDAEHRLQVATAALLIEIARADFHIEDQELDQVAASLKTKFALTAQEVDGLIELATQEAKQAISYYEFTSLINQGFSFEQKLKVIELMWQVAYADDYLQKYEEALIRKISDLLYIPHSDFIAAKHRVKPH
ncbi:tellurite resistance TerB family protein [Kaarinaea lacus]